MTTTIEYEPEQSLTWNEEMTVYSIEKLLNGMTLESVNQVLGNVAARMKTATYQPPSNRFKRGDWDEAVMNTVKDNISDVASAVAKQMTSVIAG